MQKWEMDTNINVRVETSVAEQYHKIDQFKACDCLKIVSFRNEEALLIALPLPLVCELAGITFPRDLLEASVKETEN